MSRFKSAYQRFLSLTNLQTRQYTDSPKELRASLKRVSAFLSHLENPQDRLSFVHIAGTSGKGSVAFILHQK